jgi:hypothetical protein
MYVYLLHFDKKIGHALHYMGSCEQDRLDKRMREHQTGNGASITKRAVEQGAGFVLAGLWVVADRAEEKKMKRRGHFKETCLECVRSEHAPDLFRNVLYFPPLPFPGQSQVLSY